MSVRVHEEGLEPPRLAAPEPKGAGGVPSRHEPSDLPLPVGSARRTSRPLEHPVDSSVDTSARARLIERLTDSLRELLLEGDRDGANRVERSRRSARPWQSEQPSRNAAKMRRNERPQHVLTSVSANAHEPRTVGLTAVRKRSPTRLATRRTATSDHRSTRTT